MLSLLTAPYSTWLLAQFTFLATKAWLTTQYASTVPKAMLRSFFADILILAGGCGAPTISCINRLRAASWFSLSPSDCHIGQNPPIRCAFRSKLRNLHLRHSRMPNNRLHHLPNAEFRMFRLHWSNKFNSASVFCSQ